jgi:glucose dehydrogenase
MMLFLSVTRLFAADPTRNLPDRANPILFHAFERYQLILAAVALVLALGWLMLRRSMATTLVFACLVMATVGAVVSTAWTTPRIDRLQARDLIHTPEFRRAHAQSMIVYTAGAALLLLGGLALAGAITADAAGAAGSPIPQRELSAARQAPSASVAGRSAGTDCA